jgi:hypothetical protein
MEVLFPLAFVAFLVAVVFRIMLRSRGQAPIKSPTLGFLNLAGDEFLPLIDTDRAALAPIFSEVKTGAGYQIPNCDILFIYANVTPDGSVGLGVNLTVRPSGKSRCRDHSGCFGQFFGKPLGRRSASRAKTSQPGVDP